MLSFKIRWYIRVSPTQQVGQSNLQHTPKQIQGG